MSLGSSTGDLSYPAHVGFMHTYMLGRTTDISEDDVPRGIMGWLKAHEGHGTEVFSGPKFSGSPPSEEGYGSDRIPDSPHLYIGSDTDIGYNTTSEAIRAFLSAISDVGSISWVDEFDAAAAADVSVVLDAALISGASEASSIVTAAANSAADEADAMPVSDIVQTYEDDTENQYNDALRRFNTSMAFIGAVNGSGFAIGRAMIESVRGKDVNKFESNIKRQSYQNALNMYGSISSNIAGSVRQSRTRLAIQGADTMVKVLLSKASLESDLANMWMESNVQLNQARVDYTERNLEHAMEMYLWPLRIYQYAVPLQSPGGGMGYEAGRLTRAQSALSGAAAGGSLGAALGGKEYGKLGAGVGAFMGGAAGWFGY